MIIRTPSPALAKRIRFASKTGLLVVRDINNVPGAPPSMSNRSEVLRANGTHLDEPERVSVSVLIAADDAEPFT